ncbi:MAG TPA: hypothetical protein VFW64_01815 [Pseudonocardiaceae bacterium]|nr:hypothetical protein [Pseudonocardiaceae bacterium]
MRAALTELRARIVTVTVDLLGAPPEDIALAPPGTVPKTSRSSPLREFGAGPLGANCRPKVSSIGEL